MRIKSMDEDVKRIYCAFLSGKEIDKEYCDFVLMLLINDTKRHLKNISNIE